jgi:hypothetical protein
MPNILTNEEQARIVRKAIAAGWEVPEETKQRGVHEMNIYHEILKTAYLDMEAEKQEAKLHGIMLTEKERQAFKPFRDLFDSVAEIVVTNRKGEKVPLAKLTCENRPDCIQFYDGMGNCGWGVSVSAEDGTLQFYIRNGFICGSKNVARVSREDAWAAFVENLASMVGKALMQGEQ